jgi:hypothetical protein
VYDRKVVRSTLDVIENAISEFNTEYKLQKKMTEMKLIVKNDTNEIDFQVKSKRVGDTVETKRVAVEICTSDVKNNFKLFLQVPGLFQSMSNYYKELMKSTKVKNFVNGKLWKSKIAESGDDKKRIPFYLFFDDFTGRNQLSHRKKSTSISGFYALFPCLPPEYRSKIESCLLVAAIKTENIKSYGFEKCLKPVIDALKEMETDGIAISVENQEYIVYPCMVQIIGDNKGLNEILNLVGSFISKRHCRICFEEKSNMAIQTVENIEVIRNKNSHDNHVAENNWKETGVKGECCFNILDSFKSYNNKMVDLHHDILHGSCNFVLSAVLGYYVKEGLLDLDRLQLVRVNTVLESDGKNRNIVPITFNDIENEKLPFNAVEMKQLTLYLPLLLDHMIADKRTPHWQLLISLIDILELSLLPEHDQETINKMKELVKIHLGLYRRLVRDLRFKQHALVHYARAIEYVGPPLHYSALRGEAKHQEIKRILDRSKSNTNLTKTIVQKFNYKMASMSVVSSPFDAKLCLKKKKKQRLENDNHIEYYLRQNEYMIENLFEAKSVVYFGIKFKPSYIIYENDSLLEIKTIYTDEEKCTLHCVFLDGFTYKSQLRCFLKNDLSPNADPEYTFIDLNAVTYAPSMPITLPSGSIAVKFYKKFERV